MARDNAAMKIDGALICLPQEVAVVYVAEPVAVAPEFVAVLSHASDIYPGMRFVNVEYVVLQSTSLPECDDLGDSVPEEIQAERGSVAAGLLDRAGDVAAQDTLVVEAQGERFVVPVEEFLGDRSVIGVDRSVRRNEDDAALLTGAGYASCPLLVGDGKAILAEFIYGGIPQEVQRTPP